jgi:hypothetical protein
MQQARRASALRAMPHSLTVPIAGQLVSPVSRHRWTVSIVQPRWDKHRVRGELQCESYGPASFAPAPTKQPAFQRMRSNVRIGNFRRIDLAPDHKCGALDPKFFLLIIVKKFCK